MILYHTSRRVNNKGDVRIVHYERGRPDFISHEYNSPCTESILDYAGAMQLKLKLAGIHDSTDLMTIFEDRTEAQASNEFKIQLNDVNQKGIKTSTIRLLKQETLRHLSHAIHNSIQYAQMIVEIGVDAEPEVFPIAHVLLHHVGGFPLILARISKYITGTDRRSIRVLTVTRSLTRGMQYSSFVLLEF
jgi:hypothetical protein